MCFICFAIPGHCEFARAAVQCILDNTIPQAHYMGFVRKDFFAKIHESISSTLYEYWDNSEISGPKQRPRESNTSAPLGFKLLAVNSHGQVVWPDSIEGLFRRAVRRLKSSTKRRLNSWRCAPMPHDRANLLRLLSHEHLQHQTFRLRVEQHQLTLPGWLTWLKFHLQSLQPKGQVKKSPPIILGMGPQKAYIDYRLLSKRKISALLPLSGLPHPPARTPDRPW